MALNYISVETNYLAIKEILLGGQGSTPLLSVYEPEKTIYEGTRVDNMGFLLYDNIKQRWVRPFGVPSIGEFSFYVGLNQNRVKITVAENNETVTGMIVSNRKSYTWTLTIPSPITPQSRDATAYIWTLLYNDKKLYLANYRIRYNRYDHGSGIYFFDNASILGSSYYTLSNEDFYDDYKSRDLHICSPKIDSDLNRGFNATAYYVEPSVQANRTLTNLFLGGSGTLTGSLDVDLDDVIKSKDPEAPDIPIIDPDTPLEPGDYPEDDIGEPPLPSISITDSGFLTIFNPTTTELANLSQYMWSDAFSLDSFKKLVADPMDAVIGLSILPCAIPNGGVGTVNVGNISTGIQMIKAASQWVRVDCGSINVRGQWGTYTDYLPYTKVSIFLPYIGINQLNTDDIIGANIKVVYHIDICTGSLVCYVIITKGGHERLMYTYNSQCAIQVPLTGVSYASQMQAVIGAAVTAVTAGVAGVAEVGAGLATNAVGGLQKLKPDVQRSGSFSQSCGLMAQQIPYLIWERPEIRTAANFEKYRGVGSQVTDTISKSKGYTVVDDINLSGLSATDAEKNEIIGLLKGGVII